MSVMLMLNAGSSTLKSSLLAAARTNPNLELICRGAIEGIGSQSGCFRARDKHGDMLEDKAVHGLRGPRC